jgi:hypothetical protein
MRAIWKGSISFGLVNIPIALYPATKKEDLRFRLLRKSDLSPVNYKRVAEADGKEVPWWKRDKGETKEGAEADEGDRSRLGFATKPCPNCRDQEKIDNETRGQTSAASTKGGVNKERRSPDRRLF